MASLRFNTVDQYVASLDPVKAKTVKSIINVVLTEFPELDAKIAWNVPQIHRHGKYVAGLAAYKHHLTIAPWSQGVMDGFKQRLSQYVIYKGCFQVPVDWEVDAALLKDMVKARLAELE